MFTSSAVRRASHQAARRAPHRAIPQYLLLIPAALAAYAVDGSLRSQKLDAEAAPGLETRNGRIIDQGTFETKRTAGGSTEDNREAISSQHAQMKRSWENPGVYAWGSNLGRVVAPDSEERWIKQPRRMSFLDGVLLRDIKLDKNFGAAIDEKGNLLQWGVGYAPNIKVPEVTLKDRNLKSLAISEDRIVALADGGAVFSIPISREEQQKTPKLKEDSWLWSGITNIGCRSMTPKNLGFGEKVTSISGGLHHVLMLTSSGRVYSAASSTKDYPERGQLGIPNLSWYTRPSGPFDQPHEVTGLKGVKVKQIAAGDTHSLALDKRGTLYAFGDNSHGQCGVSLVSEGLNLNQSLNINPHIVDSPVKVPIAKLYPNAYQVPPIKTIAAGGQNSYFVVETNRKDGIQTGNIPRTASEITSDAWACGRGIWGTLGTGKWTHVQWGPAKIPALSGLYEYDESKRRSEPIRVGGFVVGQSHVAAVMDNITRVGVDSRSGHNDTNWGSDVYFFGNNEHFQLGTGKRNNAALPTHIQPLGSKRTEDSIGQLQRFQLTPAKKITFAGRSVNVEQRIECGRQCSAVYSAPV